MARLYANENFPRPAVEALRQFGHDVLTVAETGRAEQAWPDREVLQFAADDGRLLVTLNRKHFIKLHRAGMPHAGIVVCTFDTDFSALAQRIDNEIKSKRSLTGDLVRINRSPNA